MDKFAICEECEWHGLRTELKVGREPMEELCPMCGSASTWWTDAPNYELAAKDR